MAYWGGLEAIKWHCDGRLDHGPVQIHLYPHDRADLFVEHVDYRLVSTTDTLDPFGHQGAQDRILISEVLQIRLSRAMGSWAIGAEQKCTSREVIGQRKCPRQL